MSPKHVLVVDDTREIGRMIQAALETLGSGLQTTVLPTAEDALLEIDRQAYDLMVIDVRLPGISGLELTRKLRSRRSTAKVIQISGINDPRLREMATQLGADLFFSKPLIMNEFLAAVERLIGSTKTSPRLGSASSGKSRPRTQLNQALSTLRQRLGANAVVLFDHNGKAISGAGELPSAASPVELYQIISTSLSAAEKAGRLLSQPGPENLVIIRGAEYDLIAAPVGGGHVTLVVVQRSPSAVRLAVAMDELLNGQKGLAILLPQASAGASRLPERSRPPEAASHSAGVKPEAGRLPEKPLPSEEQLDSELASLFSKHDLPPLQPADVDAFWNNAADDKDASADANQDVISFEQAQKMGLAPKEGN